MCRFAFVCLLFMTNDSNASIVGFVVVALDFVCFLLLCRFTWRSDGVITLNDNSSLCWSIEGHSTTPSNGMRLQLSDGCDYE